MPRVYSFNSTFIEHFPGVMPGIVLGSEINYDEHTSSALQELSEWSGEADLHIVFLFTEDMVVRKICTQYYRNTSSAWW